MLEWKDLSTLVESSWLNVESADVASMGCMQTMKAADFIAFNEDFFEFIGKDAKVEMVQAFEGEDAEHVHEAPAYVPQTGELVFADTSVIGWLWALDLETSTVSLPSAITATLTRSCLLTSTP